MEGIALRCRRISAHLRSATSSGYEGAMFRLLACVALAVVLSACSSPRYEYRYVPGKTATLQGGYAVAPPAAPAQVQMAIAAANRIAGSPYARGGGHGR